MSFFTSILYVTPNYFSDYSIFFIPVTDSEVQTKLSPMYRNHNCSLNLEDQSNEIYTNSSRASGFAC